MRNETPLPGRRNRPHIALCLHGFAHTGGASQALMGLIKTLGTLDDGAEEYTLVVRSQELAEWLKPHCGPNQRLAIHCHLGDPMRSQAGNYGSPAKGLKARFRPAIRHVQHLLSPPRAWMDIPVSDGFVESLDCDVVHFPAYWFMLCNVRSIYNPHDLQHLVYPQYISQQELLMREVVFPAGCRFSHTIVVGTQWVKDDVVRRYAVDADKVQIVPWASPTHFYSEPSTNDMATVRERYRLHTSFALFPANTWPHKNHLGLLDAVALLRDRDGLAVHVVCTGAQVEWFWPKIEARLHQLNLAAQVRFVGSVSNDDLRALYRMAQFLVMPTLYEADSNPIHEAWVEDLPVASSNVTALPDQVKDAGILFDPRDPHAIGAALARLATNEDLRDELRLRGRRRARDFSWERTAKAYRAVYRRAADVNLTEEDRWLLQWDWLREPEKSYAPARPGSVPASL